MFKTAPLSASSFLAAFAHLVSFMALACAPPSTADDVEASPPEALVAQETELKSHVESLTVWVRTALRPEQRGGRRLWFLRGRTGANIKAVTSFVVDDAFGHATLVGPRSFEIALDAHELNSLLSGLRLFVAVEPASAKTAPATLALQVAPTFVDSDGDSALTVGGWLQPINYGGELRYRGTVDAAASGSLIAETGRGAALAARALAEGKWAVDFTFDDVEAEASDRARLRVSLLSTPIRIVRTDVALKVSFAQLVRGDLETLFPVTGACLPAVQLCLDTLPGGALDYAGCGDHRTVTRCDLPSDLPAIQVIENDEVTPILEAAAVARLGLGDGAAVYVNAYYVLNRTDTRPSLAKVVRGLVNALQLTEVVDEGELQSAALQSGLAAWNATPILEAARAAFAVADEDRRANRLRLPDRTLEVVYYPNAARLMVVELVPPRR